MGYVDAHMGGGVTRRTISGPDVVEDAFVQLSAPNNNTGASGSIQFGAPGGNARRTLVRCASAALPLGTIVAFRFGFYRSASGGSTVADTINAYLVAAANSWAEGSAVDAAQAGSACWNQLAYGAPGTPWAGSAGCGGIGTDFDADASPPALAFDPMTGGGDVMMTITLKAAWVEAWRAGRTNNGMILRVANEVSGHSVFARSSEYGSNVPFFEIDYALGGSIPPGFLARRS